MAKLSKGTKRTGSISRNRARKAKHTHPTPKLRTSVGELIAAAFDTVGNEVKDVAKLLGSPGVNRAMDRMIVFV